MIGRVQNRDLQHAARGPWFGLVTLSLVVLLLLAGTGVGHAAVIHLESGGRVRGEIIEESDDAITIPVEAVVHRLRKELSDDILAKHDKLQAGLDLSERAREAQYIKVVYVMEDEVARLRLIEPGIADSKRVELRTGVTMDDDVIVGPYRTLDQLKDGRKVALAEEEKKEGAPTEKEEKQVAEGDEKDGNDENDEKDDDRVARGG